MSQQLPSIGRIVHVVIKEGTPATADHPGTDPVIRPAIIVRVWDATCVNLRVFRDGAEAAERDLAEQMFDAYNAQGPNPGKTWDGKDVPPFSAVGPQVQGKWCAAAQCAIRLASSRSGALLLMIGLALLTPRAAHAITLDEVWSQCHAAATSCAALQPRRMELTPMVPHLPDIQLQDHSVPTLLPLSCAPERGPLIDLAWRPAPEGLLLAAGEPSNTPGWLTILMAVVAGLGGTAALWRIAVWLSRTGIQRGSSLLVASAYMQAHTDLRALTEATALALDHIVVGLDQVERPLLGEGPLTPELARQMADRAIAELRRAAQVEGLPVLKMAIEMGSAWLYGQIKAAVDRMNTTRDASAEVLVLTPGQQKLVERMTPAARMAFARANRGKSTEDVDSAIQAALSLPAAA